MDNETFSIGQILAWLRFAKKAGHTISDLIEMLEYNYHEIPSQSIADKYASDVHQETQTSV